MAALTEANLQARSGKTRAQQEQELWEKMQTISELLGQVDAALETASSAPPGTGQSQRPGSQRPASQRGKTPLAGAPGTAAPPSAAPPTGSSVRSTASQRRAVQMEPQLAVIHDEPPGTATTDRDSVHLVSYTGTQSNVGYIQSRRHNSGARAAQSSIGSCLGWDAPN